MSIQTVKILAPDIKCASCNETMSCFLFLKPFVAVITCRDIQHSPDAVAPGLCWADRGGWDVVDAGGVPVCRV